jgi:riboflavin synthase
MFTGIIEASGRLVKSEREQNNVHFTFTCPFTQELKTDQSVAHNGVCLTVVKIEGDSYTVTAISETLQRTNLGAIKVGDVVNLERCLPVTGRMDGHIVQGHVDGIGICREIADLNGSWRFVFGHERKAGFVTVEKGSICVNGVSLTVVDSNEDSFSVHVIPYTYENTNLARLSVGSPVNLEFDIIGKYVSRLLSRS